MILGTVHYASPEQIQELAVLGTADQYSLGCVLYECLTGRAPFEKSSNEAIMWAHVHEQPAPPTMLRPDLPPAIDEVIARVLAKAPGDRYASCREFIADARSAIAPARSYQAAPVSSGQFSAPVQPTATDQRYPAAFAGGPTDPWAAQRAPGGTDYGDQFAFASEPVRRRRVRRRQPGERARARSAATLVAIGASAAVIAGGGAATGVFLAKTGNIGTPPARATDSASAPASVLYTALNNMASDTKRVPMSTCKQLTTTAVQCTNPDPSIGSVTFETFPTLPQLYAGYESFVGKLAGKPFAAEENQSACGDLAPDPTAENTWDHSDRVTKYTAVQMAAGKVADTAAMGRVFCEQTSTGSENIVWTQDSGRLLAFATGTGPHHLVWQWYYEVHHFITFPGQAAMPAMPGMPTP
jgi:hypothetical protein